MVVKYQDNGGCQWRRRQHCNIGGGGTAAAEKGNGYWWGVGENNKGHLIWGRRWRQGCCNVDLLTPGQAREGVYLGDFKKKKIVGREFTRLLEKGNTVYFLPKFMFTQRKNKK
jgi:hypothetical protein